jgi:Holliday junction resolvasome RuvABC endonuclease subunit
VGAFDYRDNTVAVAGVHIRVHDDRYLAGLAIVDGRDLLLERSLPAPADSDLGRQLEELYELARDLFQEHTPQLLALKASEAQGRALKTAMRAEGCVLAAAGVQGVPVRVWHGAGLRRPAGLTSSSSVQQCVTSLCNELSQAPATNEASQAAAVARASIKQPGR